MEEALRNGALVRQLKVLDAFLALNLHQVIHIIVAHGLDLCLHCFEFVEDDGRALGSSVH